MIQKNLSAIILIIYFKTSNVINFNLFNNSNFTDCHTGYWVYDLKKIQKNWLKNFDNGFLFDLDMRKKILENNYEIKEIPIVTRYGNERSSTHLNYAIRFFFKSIFS